MATDPLFSVRVKIDRAKKHLNELGAEISAFLAAQPYDIIIDENTEPGKRLYRIKNRKLIPSDWGGAIGDIVHNLRSSLDNLATALAIANGTTSKDILKNTYFPIGTCKAGFEKLLPNYLRGASPDARRLVERLKPYPGGTDAFRRLHDLDVLDKHSAIVPVGLAHTGAVWEVGLVIEGMTLPEISLPFAPKKPIYPLKDGDVIASSKHFSGGPHKENLDAAFSIAFGEGQIVDGESVIPTLQQFIDFVERVIGIFAKHILKTPW